jgi:ribosomal protein L32E
VEAASADVKSPCTSKTRSTRFIYEDVGDEELWREAEARSSKVRERTRGTPPAGESPRG